MRRTINLPILCLMLIVFVRPERQLSLEGNSQDHRRVHSMTRRKVSITQVETSTIDGWMVDEVVCHNFHYLNLTNRSLHLGQSGYPKIVYSDDNLYYASNNGVSWRIETVDDTHDWGIRSPSLDIDENGYPHISYIGKSSYIVGDYISDIRYVKYAYMDSTGWHIRSVNEARRPYISFILDGNGYPHIIYTDANYVKYAYTDGSEWYNDEVDVDATGEIVDISLAIDDDGYPHISYTDYVVPAPHGDTYHLRYAYLGPDGWNNELVEANGGRSSSLALDRNGQPHIIYHSLYNKYAHKDDSDWVIQELESSGSSTTIALDRADYPHIGYENFQDLEYAYIDIAGWHTHVVESGGDSSYPSLVLDEDEFPHLSYIISENDFIDACVKYAYRETPFSRVLVWPRENWGYGLPGSTITYTLKVLNSNQITDTFDIAASESEWPTIIPSVVGPLVPAESAVMNVQMTIPATVTLGSTDTLTITVTSQEDQTKTGNASLMTFAGYVLFMPQIEK